MKRILLTTVLLLTGIFITNLKAQEKPQISTREGKVFYEEIVEAEGLTASTLYSNARAWIATAYNNSQKVIQMDDKEAGKIITKGNFKSISGTNAFNSKTYLVEFTTDITVKDGKYRVQCYDITVKDKSLQEAMKYRDDHPLIVLDLIKDQETIDNGKSGKKFAAERIYAIDRDFKSMFRSLKAKMTSTSSDEF